MKKIISIYIMVLVLIMSCCKEKEEQCGSIHITGHVKEAINKNPLDSLKIELSVCGEIGYCYQVAGTYTDSSGYFEINYSPEEWHNFTLSTEVNEYKDKDYVFIAYDQDSNTYDYYKYEFYGEEVNCGDNFYRKILLDPLCFLKIYFTTSDTLNKGDTLILFDPEYNIDYKFYEGHVPSNKLFKIYAGQYQPIKWKIKRNNQNWVTHKDSIYCEPFTVNEYTIEY